MLCAGDLFADAAEQELDDLLAGVITVKVATYCVMGKRALPDKVIAKIEAHDGEIVTNLNFLGESSFCSELPPSISNILWPMITKGISRDRAS